MLEVPNCQHMPYCCDSPFVSFSRPNHCSFHWHMQQLGCMPIDVPLPRMVMHMPMLLTMRVSSDDDKIPTIAHHQSTWCHLVSRCHKTTWKSAVSFVGYYSCFLLLTRQLATRSNSWSNASSGGTHHCGGAVATAQHTITIPWKSGPE